MRKRGRAGDVAVAETMPRKDPVFSTWTCPMCAWTEFDLVEAEEAEQPVTAEAAAGGPASTPPVARRRGRIDTAIAAPRCSRHDRRSSRRPACASATGGGRARRARPRGRGGPRRRAARTERRRQDDRAADPRRPGQRPTPERSRSPVRPVDRGWVAGERVGAMVATPGLLPEPVGHRKPAGARGGLGLDRGAHRRPDRRGAPPGRPDGRGGDRAAKGYSTGMRQRLGIALALLADPPIAHPRRAGQRLDPAGIVEIRDLLLALAAGGRTILISSHLLTEVEKTCDHVTIVDHGRIVAAGTPECPRRRRRADRGAPPRRPMSPPPVGPWRPPAIEVTPRRRTRGQLWVEGAPDGATVTRLLAVGRGLPGRADPATRLARGRLPAPDRRWQRATRPS